MKTVELIAIILIFPLIFFGNFLLFQFFIERAIKTFIKPELESKGLLFVGYKWVGFWGCGDFTNEKMELAFFKSSSNSISIYSFIDYEESGMAKRLTVKIDVLDLSIQKVAYSSKF